MFYLKCLIHEESMARSLVIITNIATFSLALNLNIAKNKNQDDFNYKSKVNRNFFLTKKSAKSIFLTKR